MAVVMRLSDVIEFNYIQPEKTIVLTTRTIIYEIVVNSDENAQELILLLREALKKQEIPVKSKQLPRFYKEG